MNADSIERLRTAYDAVLDASKTIPGDATTNQAKAHMEASFAVLHDPGAGA